MPRLALAAPLLGLLLPSVGVAGQVSAPPRIGQAVPDFEATSMDGQTLSLRTAATEHKAVVVVFISALCPYVNYFADHLRDLDVRYAPLGVLFLGVNSNHWESATEVADNAREHGFVFPIIRDEHHRIADELGAERTPEAYLIDSEGRLRYRGWVKSKQESPDLQRALDAVLEGRPVPRPVTKAFGCAVDR
jgi:peroxiredoxin